MPWNPEVYEQFQKERYAPFDDLIALVKPRPGICGIDLGCGTGELTKRLYDFLPESTIVGIDSSAEMLATAQTYVNPTLRFELKSIENVEGNWDLIFSHAAIHWVPDHHQLLSRLFAMVRPAGQLVVQLPSNYDHPVMQLIRDIASQPPFKEALSGWTQPIHVLKLADYARILYRIGGSNITIYEKVYPYVLKDSDALSDWTSGTALVPYMEKLSGELKEQFMKKYREELRRMYPEEPVFFDFARILFAATK